jgi:hypothetical protein
MFPRRHPKVRGLGDDQPFGAVAIVFHDLALVVDLAFDLISGYQVAGIHIGV